MVLLLQALNAAQKSANTQVNNLPVANPTNVYTTGGYEDPNAIPNDPSKNSVADPQTNTQVRLHAGFLVSCIFLERPSARTTKGQRH